MKQLRSFSLCILAASFMMSSTGCATILGGPTDSCQRSKAANGGATRQPRVGFLIADIILGVVPVIVDVATTAIYKPCSTSKSAKASQ